MPEPNEPGENTILCSRTSIRPNIVEHTREALPAGEVLGFMAELFKCLGDPTRLKIIHALQHAELCVCELGALLGMSTPAVSHHLKLLRHLRLVSYRREGQVVFYALADEHVDLILSQALSHVQE